jgi:methyltransferase (TIGR00027 family)
MAPLQLPTGVGWTALITAYARARETRRPDRLYEDQFAVTVVDSVLGGHASGNLPRVGPARDDGSSRLWNMCEAYFSIRTPFYDQQLQAGLHAGARQIVILAAGMDSRSIRLDFPSDTRIFEVDSREVLEFKADLMAQSNVAVGNRTPVAADLREDWTSALLASGFQPSEPTVWLAEGLLMYLDEAQCDRLLATITAASAPGSRFITEDFTRVPTMDDIEAADQDDLAAAELVLSLFQTGIRSSPRDWLTGHQWTPRISDVAAELRRHDRELPKGFDQEQPNPFNVWLMAGTR